MAQTRFLIKYLPNFYNDDCAFFTSASSLNRNQPSKVQYNVCLLNCSWYSTDIKNGGK